MKKIAHRIVLSVALLFVSFAALTIVIVRSNTMGMLEDIVGDKLEAESTIIMELIDAKIEGPWEVKDNNLYKGDILINDNNELVDSIKSFTGDEVTLFAEDVRVATTVEENGQRQVGTAASADVKEQVFGDNQTYIGKAEVVGESYNTIYLPLEGSSAETVGMLFIGKPTSYQENITTAFAIKLMLYMGILMVIAFVATYFLGQSLAKPIVRLNDLAVNISNLDVTEEIDEDLLERKDEVGHLANSFKTLSLSLRDFVSQVADASEQVLQSAGNMSASSEELYAASEDMSETMQEISFSSETQASESNETNEGVNELAEGIVEVLHSSNALNKIADATETLKNNGLGTIDNLMERTRDSGECMNEVEAIILETQKSAEEISEIVDLIDSISAQTNLLSLNASIEAARAGESGRGFAVVAQEIGDLAEQSSASTEQVEAIINELQTKVTNTVNTLDEMRNILEFQESAAHDTNEIFDDLAVNLVEIRNESSHTTRLGESMNKMKDRIVSMIGNISVISEQNAASTQQVAATTEEQSAASSEVAKDSESLSQLAVNLQEMVETFKI